MNSGFAQSGQNFSQFGFFWFSKLKNQRGDPWVKKNIFSKSVTNVGRYSLKWSEMLSWVKKYICGMVWTCKRHLFSPCTLYRACTAVLRHEWCMNLWFWHIYSLIYTFLESSQLFWLIETILAKIWDTFWKNIFFHPRVPPLVFELWKIRKIKIAKNSDLIGQNRGWFGYEKPFNY